MQISFNLMNFCEFFEKKYNSNFARFDIFTITCWETKSLIMNLKLIMGLPYETQVNAAMV